MKTKPALPPSGPTKPKPDVNKGANMFKTRLIAYLEREQKQYESDEMEYKLLTDILRWVRTTDERAGKRLGGIGRR